MDKANIVSVQMRPKIGYKQKNLDKVKQLLEQYLQEHPVQPDLILLPEFFNTGISVPEFKKLAEPQDANETVAFLSDIAKEYKTYLLAGSIIERRGEKLYNTSRLLDRNGNCVAKYDKIHLFDSFGGEEHTYCTRGEELVVAETDFGNVGMAVCFDIRFPQHFLKLIKMGAEIIVEPAAWACLTKTLLQDTPQWRTMNKSRAMDNMVFFVSSNQCGKINSFLTACGHSMICSPDGSIMAEAGEEETVISAQINLQMLKSRRSQFNMENLTQL